jgi:hypothetical protein
MLSIPNLRKKMKTFHRLIPVAALFAASSLLTVNATMAKSDVDHVIAIDVLLLPDAAMVEHAKEAMPYCAKTTLPAIRSAAIK